MPRKPRCTVGGLVYHVLNRGNCRMNIFDSTGDFAAFVALLELARRKFPGVRILAWCLMHNHWHLILWPKEDGELSLFMQWLTSTHVRRWREFRGSVGHGHLYQGRFKSFAIERDEHLLTAIRYVEANPLRARMVDRAEAWAWSSLTNPPGVDDTRIELCDWPVDRPRDWKRLVNEAIDERDLKRLHASVLRDRPFGSESWTARMVKRLGLESTTRNPWRPKRAIP